MNKEFFTANRQELLKNIENDSVVVMFAGKARKKTGDENYFFTPNRNFYYETGMVEENIILLITKTESKVEEILFIEKSDPVWEKWVGKKISPEEAKAVSGIENIQFIDEFEGKLNRILSSRDYYSMYLDIERLEADELPTREELFAEKINKKYPYLRIRNVYNIICDKRVIKTPEEIEKMQKAIDITGEGIKNIMNNAKPGILEYQLEAYFDFTLKTSGVRDKAFPTIAAAGVNGTVLHYDKNDSVIGEDDLIVFDLGAQWEYYNADITRTIPASGKFTERQKEIYNIVLKAQYETIKAMKPGVPIRNLNVITKKVYAEELQRIGLIKDESEVSKYYYHGVSHHIGLDTHDVGSYDIDLKPGMVLTVEPGLYIEEEKIGIRIEDDVLITENGCEVLSKNIIKTVEEIEEYMSKR